MIVVFGSVRSPRVFATILDAALAWIQLASLTIRTEAAIRKAKEDEVGEKEESLQAKIHSVQPAGGATCPSSAGTYKRNCPRAGVAD